MTRQSIEKIKTLKSAVLVYLGTNGRHYGDLSRLEQSVEDLAQALNTRLDQLLMSVECGQGPAQAETPRDRLADRFMATANRLMQTGGRVDRETATEFERALDLFDTAADLRRQSETVRDAAETSAIRRKLGRQ